MTNRVPGKTKKKSIKANVTSKFGTTRVLSRMGKKVKKGKAGPSTEFITRSTVLKRLQISLKDFRRLSILKGIYPRVPVKAPKGADKVYYDIKDISYLSHEPLLFKFREFKTFMRKLRRAAGRKDFEDARRRNEYKPVFALDHLVKERYPRFIDALRDLDDALCMIHLFAALPSEGRITTEHTTICKELVHYWQFYVAKSTTLKKTFISVKGIYYQAEIMGESITWLSPHPFTQALPREVDLRVMITFLEFYETLLKFVLFKLYNTQQLKYPPLIDKELYESGSYLFAIKAIAIDSDTITGTPLQLNTTSSSTTITKPSTTPISNIIKKQSKSDSQLLSSQSKIINLESKMNEIITKDAEMTNNNDDDDDNETSLLEPLQHAFVSLQDKMTDIDNDLEEEERKIFSKNENNNNASTPVLLFKNFKFFINREVNLDWMQFTICSFGGMVGWEGLGSPYTVDDARITHQVIDRPIQATAALTTTSSSTMQREYIQPQWVFDCINAQFLLPVTKYAPGVTLPPHLSPFVDDAQIGYIPKYREELLQLQSASSSTTTTGIAIKDQDSNNNNGEKEVDDDDDDDKNYEIELRAEKAGVSFSKAKLNNSHKVNSKVIEEEEDKEESPEDDDDEAEDPPSEIEEEEEEEELPPSKKIKDTSSTSKSKGTKALVYVPEVKEKTEDQEVAEMSQIMMSKKTKRLYGRMKHGIEQKESSAQRLLEKRQLTEATTKKSDRLSMKRSIIEVDNVPSSSSSVITKKSKKSNKK